MEEEEEDRTDNDNTSLNNCFDDDNGSEYSIVISIGDMEGDIDEFEDLDEESRQQLQQLQQQQSQDNSIDLLVNEMKQTKLEPNMCVRCGSNGHYAKDCYASHDINNELIIDDIDNSFYEN